MYKCITSKYTHILHIHDDKWHLMYDFNVGMQREILGPIATQSAHCQPKVTSPVTTDAS